MNLASKIQKTSRDPRKWIGRRARECRKHGKSVHYVNETGQVGCIECDQPPDSRVSLRLMAHDGIWYDSDNGFSEETPQRATQSLLVGGYVEENGKRYQVMPTDNQGEPVTWYDYDEQRGPPPGLRGHKKWEAYVYLKWLMREFNASGRQLDGDSEVRYGKRR